MTTPDREHSEDSFTTATVHSDRRFGIEHGGIHKPIHTSTQYGFERTEDLIGVLDCGKSVCDDQSGSSLHQSAQCVLNQMFAGGVQIACCFI